MARPCEQVSGSTARPCEQVSHVLDRYVLAKRGFCEVLTNWYVRRSRDRFWAGRHDAIDTLYTVLEVACRVAAPLLPLTTEAIWRGLTGQRSSVTVWPFECVSRS